MEGVIDNGIGRLGCKKDSDGLHDYQCLDTPNRRIQKGQIILFGEPLRHLS